jgi:putative copper export protein
MRGLYLLSVWLHVVAAAAWVGSLVFVAAVLVPVLRRGDDLTRGRVLRAAGPAMRALGWTAFGLLLVTGIGNLAGRGFLPSDVAGRLWWGPFGRALAWKLGLFLVVLALSAVHDFRLGPRAAAAGPGSPEAARLRRAASWLGRLNLLLALAILVFAVMLVRGWP